MNIIIRKYTDNDIEGMIAVWNEVVEDGVAFPQEECLTVETGAEFFAAQTYCGVAEDTDNGEIVGMYILHPNNVGRCGHICNASYAVKSSLRGMHIGERLVTDCMEQGRAAGFKILQFNAVVRTNYSARHLYEKLGFVKLGVIPKGFLLKNGNYEDIVPYYHEL
ncbi:MAG: GNAT family N-acetyltransferase [Acutalibacteraceae bacterium]|nr:GNAT family N-acetyltransferase [Bacillota bacterium]